MSLFVSRSALTAAAFTCMLAAAPVRAEYQVSVMRLSGEWQTSLGTMKMAIDSFEGAAHAQILDSSSGAPRYRLWRNPSDVAETDGGAKFYWISAGAKCSAFDLRCAEGRINLKLDASGRSLEATTIDGQLIGGFARWSGTRLKNSTAAERTFAAWLGSWNSSRGPINFRVEGEILVGEFQTSGTASAQGRGYVTLFPGGWGAWSLPDASSLQRGRADLRLAADKQGFSGTYQLSLEDDRGAPRAALTWTGTRNISGGASPPRTSEPGPVVAQPQQPAPSQPTPGGSTPVPSAVGFKPVGNFEVRLDKVVAEDRYWHVYMTLRNASSDLLVQAQGVNVRFEDTDGVGVETRQAVRAKPGYPELFGSPPPITRPGGTLPVKFVFDKRSGADPAKIIVMEDDKSAEFTLG